MVTSMLPTMVFAEDGEETVSEETVTEEVTEPEEEPVEEETEPEEEAEEAEEEISETVPAANAGDMPAGAVAYVTNANGTAVDAEGEEEGDLGGGYYGTLAAAIAACPGDSTTAATGKTTIKMVDDVNYGEFTQQYALVIPKGKNIVLDLNSKRISGMSKSGTNSAVINIEKGATLTVDDFSERGEGRIYCAASPTWIYGGTNVYSGSYASNAITTLGNLIVNNGKIENATKEGSAVYPIDCYAGTLEINGGVIRAARSNAIRLWGLHGDVKATINDGYIETSFYPLQIHGGNVDLTVNGGEMITTGDEYALNIYSAAAGKKQNVTITGGHFGGAIGIGSDHKPDTVELKISGNPVIDGDLVDFSYNNTFEISGGTFKGCVDLSGPATITGGNFTGYVKTLYYNDAWYYNKGISGGTFKDTNNYQNYDVYVKNGTCYYRTTEYYYVDCTAEYKALIQRLYGDSSYQCYDMGAYGPEGCHYVQYHQNWSNFTAPRYYNSTTDTYYEKLSREIYAPCGESEDYNYISTIQGFKDIGLTDTFRDFDENGYEYHNLYQFGVVLYPAQIVDGYFAMDNEDGTYSVVPKLASTHFTYDIGSNSYVKDWDYISIADALSDIDYVRTTDQGGWNTTTNRVFTITLCRDTNEKFTLPAGVTFVIPRYTEGENAGNEMYAYTGTVSAPAGMAVVKTNKTDGTYYTVRQEGQQTNIETKTNEEGQPVTVVMEAGQDPVAVPDIKITGNKDGEGEAVALADDELKKAAVEAAAAITENEAVTNFKEVGINEALKAESEAKDKEQKVDVKVDAVVVTQETAVIKELTGAENSTSTTTFQASFDVKPMVKSEAPAATATEAEKKLYKKDANDEWWKIIRNEDIQGEVTFRLPVQSSVTKDTVAVYHKASAETQGKGDFQGFFPVQGTVATGKYVELKASEFSVYTYEVMTSVSQNDLFAIPNDDGTYTGYEDLTTLTTAIGASTDKKAILLQDLKLGAGETFDFGYSGEGGVSNPTQFTLDLNGHTLKGASVNSKKVTLINSNLENYALLQATGTYANDVKGLCSDGYDAKDYDTEAEGNDNRTVYKPGNSDYQVVVEVTTNTDCDTTNDEVDVFAGDTVTVTVSILGARYAAADVTLTYDKDNFTVKSAPKSNWTKDLEAGTFRFYNAKKGGGYYEPGKMTNATFTFTVKEGDAEVIKDMFTVSTSDTYVAPAWASGWDSDAAAKLDSEQITDDWANIRLKQMNASVTPNTGLSYKEIGQTLLASGYTATNALNGAVIDDATISYAILTKAEADGTVQMKDEDGNLLFKNGDGYLVTEDTGTPAYEPAKAPAAEDYKTVQPTVTDAGDYTIFWKITRKGYIPVSGKENVSIAPLNVTLNWTMPKDNKDAVEAQGTQGQEGYVAGYTPIVIKLTDMAANDGAGETDGKGDKITADYWGSYSEFGFGFSTEAVTSEDIDTTKNIVASVVALNQNRIATVTMTGKPDVAQANVMKTVGTYEFTADLGSNYNISNPTVTVLVDGGKIVGYDLSATTEGASVFYDGKEHTATVMTPGTNATPDVAVKYCYSTDNGETWTEWGEEIPVLTNSNPFPYIIKMQLSKDSFYTQEKTFNFSIKPVQYYTEKADYITGWDLVLCYTDEAVPSFNYDGKMMYDVTSFGYKLGTVWNADGTAITTEGQSYAHVYAYLVEGTADTSKVLPSNVTLVTTDGATYRIDLNTEKGRMDVNKSGTIDINDLVAVQAVYNVDKASLTGVGATGDMADLSEQARMAIVLRADVSGDKIVDTYDCSLIITNTGK